MNGWILIFCLHRKGTSIVFARIWVLLLCLSKKKKWVYFISDAYFVHNIYYHFNIPGVSSDELSFISEIRHFCLFSCICGSHERDLFIFYWSFQWISFSLLFFTFIYFCFHFSLTLGSNCFQNIFYFGKSLYCGFKSGF